MSGRSSFSNVDALALLTTVVDGGVTVTGAMLVGLADVNNVPEPSSMMVAIPVTAVNPDPAAGVAVRLNVSALSGVVSLAMAVRTNSRPLLLRLTVVLLV